MNRPPSRTVQRRLTWRIAGFWMVLLALGLAVLGMILAVQQMQSLSAILMSQSQRRALDIAANARRHLHQMLDLALRDAGDQVAKGESVWMLAKNWRRPASWPDWLDGLYYSSYLGLWSLQEHSADDQALRELVAARLATRSATPPDEATAQGAELLYDSIGQRPVVLACYPLDDPWSDRRAWLVAPFDLSRLKADLLEPLLSASDGLEIVPAGPVYGPWSQPLFSVLRFWVLKPTPAFLAEQRRTVIGQTLVYLGLTLLALITLLGAMGSLVRVARREMSLAELKANFVADVSHELKTPLAVIRLYADTLQSGRVVAEDKRQEYYGIIGRESERLSNLINNILDFARIDAGRKEFTLTPTDVGQVVRDTYDIFRAELDRQGFEHHLVVPEGLPRVDADRDAVSQVLLNLMSNAVKYSGEEKYLLIELGADTRRGGHGVLISVHDRGFGIRPEDRAYLFEGFFRAADVRVREQKGTGLGLALVKHIVEAHHGSIDVEARLVKGTTFRIFLPASTAQAGIDARGEARAG